MSLLDATTLDHLLDALVSLGIGLLVGLEREHHDIGDDDKAPSRALGVRTFTLLALFGWIVAYVGVTYPWLPLVALAVVGAVTVAVAARASPASLGLTTEIAALVVFGLTLLVPQHRLVAVAAAVVTTLLLVSKPWFGELVPRLRRVDFVASLQLLVVLAIVLPLLPTDPVDPWKVLAPRKIGLFITLILGIDYVGYVVSRILGARQGVAVTGLVGGLVSSTAVTLSMARKAKQSPDLIPAGQLATLFASAVMAIRVLVIAFLLNRAVALAVAPALGATALVMAGAGLWKWRGILGQAKGEGGHEVSHKNPLSLFSALKWGAFMCVILVGAELAKQALGDRGLLLTAVVAGLADVDAITLAATRQASSGQSVMLAGLAIMLAVASNTIVKGTMAFVGGGRKFGVYVAMGFGAALVLGVAVATVMLVV